MATVNASSISANLNNIPTLTGSNFAKWKEHVSIVLGCMDLDYALRVDEPAKLTDNSTAEEKSIYEKWERSNRAVGHVKKDCPKYHKWLAKKGLSKEPDTQ
ncbi:hypothetical protein Vadar_033542 [Vaccinium darrowii]|uniref:Uncharacterized protein n=1 Tax=Vaccinium darrowii TaxID=229202 RepID=A0ACB7Z1W7_9ERIC|nr:hypothetical protein Vadar_033542 [Vaccinium darrowii]